MRSHLDRAKPEARAQGQASVEYALVLTGVLALLLALGVLHAFLEEGRLPAHALWSSSHGIERVHEDNLRDAMSV